MKMKIKDNDKGITITHTTGFENYFQGIDLSPPSQS